MAQQYSYDAQGNPTAIGGPNQVDVTNGGPSTLGSLAPHPTVTDPYTIFNTRLADMLQTATNQAVSNKALLSGAKDTLTNLSVAPAGPKPFDPSIFSGSQVAGQEALRAGFQPAITSLATQEANTAAATEGIKGTIEAMQVATQPVTLQPGQSLVSRDGTILKGGHSYTAQINPLTGLVDGFDQNTGTWASEDTKPSELVPPPKSNADLVGGIDFSGESTSTKPYATDPDKAKKVDSLYHQILSSNPIPTAPGIDQFITSYSGGKAPVTGTMIINAAIQYGIDPHVLAANIGEESGFGTAGAAVKTMNPGNVGNTGSSTQTFKSWGDGVNASAYELARRMPGNTNAKTATTPQSPSVSPIGGQFSPEASAKLKQLPTAMQRYADAGPLGIAYINSNKVPADVVQSVQTLSAKSGIPFVAPEDASAVKSIKTVLDNLDSMQALAEGNLKSGVLGHLEDMTVGKVNEWLQTDWGIKLGLFDNYRDTAIKAVQALAGGAGSGLRINMGEIAANVQNLPQSSNNKENAIAQVRQLRQLIYTQMSTSFPYAMAKVVDPKGNTGSMPIGNLATAIKQGYAVQ